MRDYVEQRKGEYYVAGTRVPLACVTQELLRGASPETIRESYPLLTLAQVYGAIAYYLDHQAAMDDHFRQVDKTYDEFRAAQRPISPELRERIERARDDDMITVVLPEFVPAKWWHHVLHNQSSLLLKGALLFRKGIIVTSVPYHLTQ